LRAPDELSAELDEAVPSSRAGIDITELSILQTYLEQLPPRLKAIYEQRFALGRSQHDTAKALGISRRAVRTGESHLARGLRLALQASGIFTRDA
jgi:DNA-directed RNA polymerase specialized sigma24 family protein